jgi:cytochrome c nitrite reductase small subunit
MRTNLIVVVAVLLGALAGVSLYAFVYAKGYSYLLNDPAACANCHVMRTQYDAWIKSSHHSAATCNDCHTPHNLLGKYAVKASNGFFHSFYFTTNLYPDTIEITRFDRGVTEAACRHCHASVTQAIDADNIHGRAQGIHCTRCHVSAGHLEASASNRGPQSLVEILESK